MTISELNLTLNKLYSISRDLEKKTRSVITLREKAAIKGQLEKIEKMIVTSRAILDETRKAAREAIDVIESAERLKKTNYEFKKKLF